MKFYNAQDHTFNQATKSDLLQSLKPIETRYSGYRFRSRLEARWAVLFDELAIKYEYEPEGFELISGPYLPDFWLPYPDDMNFSGYAGSGHWLEVKGKEPTQYELSALLHLSIASKHSGILVWGSPWNFKAYFTHRNGNHGWTGMGDSPWGPEDNEQWRILLLVNRFMNNDLMSCIPGAIQKAKWARFEYGENP